MSVTACWEGLIMMHSMNKKTILSVVILVFVLTFGLGQTGFAATVAVTSSGNGVFVIQGLGLENVGGMDITLTYDTASLANPRFASGDLISGALNQVNDRVPGMVRLGVVRISPMQGTGVIGTLTFDRKGSSPGKILAVTANFAINDKMVPVASKLPDPGDAGASGSSANQNTNPNTGAASSGGTQPLPAGGAVVLGGGLVTAETKDMAASAASGTTQPADEPRDIAKASSGGLSSDAGGMTLSAEPSKKKVQQFKSVLDRFKKFRGERTSKAFLSLFEQGEANGFTQDPPVALSDGKSAVKIMFIVPASGTATPDFALRGARLISVKKDPERSNAWVLEAQPEKGEYAASLIVSQGSVSLEYPMTLAPRIEPGQNKAGTMTEQDFSLYLTGKRRDVNGDGKRDYLDDYIFTANYIAARQGR
jgi:hypothetical protein